MLPIIAIGLVELQALILFPSLVISSGQSYAQTHFVHVILTCVAATVLYYLTDDRQALLCAVVSLMPTH